MGTALPDELAIGAHAQHAALPLHKQVALDGLEAKPIQAAWVVVPVERVEPAVERHCEPRVQRGQVNVEHAGALIANQEELPGLGVEGVAQARGAAQEQGQPPCAQCACSGCSRLGRRVAERRGRIA